MGGNALPSLLKHQNKNTMKKFILFTLGFAMFCITAHATDDVGMYNIPTSEQAYVPNLTAPVMPVVIFQNADIMTPVVMFVMQETITSQMASQVLYATIETRGIKSFVPPNYGRSKMRNRQVNHYCNNNYYKR